MDPDQIRKLLKRVAIAGAFFLVALLLYMLGWRKLLIAYALIVAVVMILAILLQSGRGGGLASLGGMGGENLLGARAATPIAKATYVMGALFLFICILVARLGLVTRAGAQPLPTGQTPAQQPASGASSSGQSAEGGEGEAAPEDGPASEQPGESP